MNTTPVPGYPFSAVVGQDQLRLALILTAIAPRIGGVVVRGEKGTAKTTTVRAFSALLGDAPLVNLPIGATEDRVVGSLNVEKILTTGHAEYQPGLLAQADGGVLYVDEVNLLADHLVDALLDAAATGAVTIERDGISHTSSANFVLVGNSARNCLIALASPLTLQPRVMWRFVRKSCDGASTMKTIRTRLLSGGLRKTRASQRKLRLHGHCRLC